VDIDGKMGYMIHTKLRAPVNMTYVVSVYSFIMESLLVERFKETLTFYALYCENESLDNKDGYYSWRLLFTGVNSYIKSVSL
jgi:hypothetical protein